MGHEKGVNVLKCSTEGSSHQPAVVRRAGDPATGLQVAPSQTYWWELPAWSTWK